MNHFPNAIFSLALCISIATVPQNSISAHEGHQHAPSSMDPSSRVWTFAQTGIPIRGAFIMAKDGKVQIRRDNGKPLMIEIATLSREDQTWIENRQTEIKAFHEKTAKRIHLIQSTSKTNSSHLSDMERAFEPFVKLNGIRYRSDDRYFYVESNGMPVHRMMVGITSWQQQVPIPQKYTGNNAWQIPLNPIESKNPLTAKNRFLRGAIALAVNGVPIFNPLNNRGDDAYLFGELDEFGGHCGRADDYHYHIAPVHLEKHVGPGAVLAYALDGYPIYGYDEPDGSKVTNLDAFNGHKDRDGNYHYHASKTYPYLNGGFHGEVIERNGQVEPQPHAEPVRPALTPLRDAKITDFVETEPGSFRLTYDQRGRTGHVNYSVDANGSARFEYIDTNGRSNKENYTARDRPRQGNGSRPPRRDEPPPRPETNRPSPNNLKESSSDSNNSNIPKLAVTSKSVNADGKLSIDCTCDGKRLSPAVSWEKGPEGTKAYAISLWHTAPDQEKSYWLIYDIPADINELTENSKGAGKIGMNDRRKGEYDPMCSKGPGIKKYHVTVYALSTELKLPPSDVNRASLLTAIQSKKLAEGTLDFTYERKR